MATFQPEAARVKTELTQDLFHCSQSPVKHLFFNNTSDALLCQLKTEIKAEERLYDAHSKDYSCFVQTALKSPGKELAFSLVSNKTNSYQNLNTITTSVSFQSADINGYIKEESIEAEINVQQVKANNDHFSYVKKESCCTKATLTSANITADDDVLHTVSSPGSALRKQNQKCTETRLDFHKNMDKSVKKAKRKKPAITQGQMCTLCGKSFTRPDHLKIHMRIHTGEKPYKCTECDKCFVRCGELSVHMRFHRGVKPYVCAKCGKHFSLSAHLKEHEYTHTGIKPHACSYCEKSFAHAGDLVKHRRIHTDERPYPCMECGMAFRRIQTLKKHEKRHTRSKTFDCIQCKKVFKFEGRLRQHMRSCRMLQMEEDGL